MFSSSLETHMRAHRKEQELKYFNDQFQLEQSKIVQEGIRMQLSQLEIMNQIKQMQESLKANIAGKMIPKSATDSPEAPIKPKEEYKPMTASDYENVLRKNGKQIKTPSELNEMKLMESNDLLPIVNELKAYRAQRKQFEEDIIHTKNQIEQLKLRANLKKLKTKEENKMQFLNNKIMKNEDLLNNIQNRLATLRPVERNTYKEPISQFKKELTEAIKARNDFQKDLKSPTSTSAETFNSSYLSSSPLSSPTSSIPKTILNLLDTKENWQRKKNDIKFKLNEFYEQYDVDDKDRIKINKNTTENEIRNYVNVLRTKKFSKWI